MCWSWRNMWYVLSFYLSPFQSLKSNRRTQVQILIHPSNALRLGARRVLTQIARIFSDIDVDVLLVPLIMPYLKEQSKFRDVYYASANLRLKERLIPESETLTCSARYFSENTSIDRASLRRKKFQMDCSSSKRTWRTRND